MVYSQIADGPLSKVWGSDAISLSLSLGLWAMSRGHNGKYVGKKWDVFFSQLSFSLFTSEAMLLEWKDQLPLPRMPKCDIVLHWLDRMEISIQCVCKALS